MTETVSAQELREAASRLEPESEAAQLLERAAQALTPAERTRTIRWEDPLASAGLGATLSGLDYLTAVLEERIPGAPIAHTLGFRPVSVTEGDVVFRCLPDESTYNPIGVVHGGLVCTLLDSALACAVHSTLPLGTGYTSLDLTVSYLRPVTAQTGEITAHGWVVKPGRRAAFAQGDVRDGQGKVLATATSTLLVMTP